MTLASPAAVLRRASFSGFYMDEDGNREDAWFAIVSDEVAGPDEAGPDAIEMNRGDLLAVFQSDGRTNRKRLTIESQFTDPEMRQDAFMVRMPDGHLSGFTGANLLHAREKLVAAMSNGDELTQDHRRLLQGLQTTIEAINENPGAFPVSAATQAWMAASIDAAGNVELPVSVEQFARKAQADLIRSKIANLDPAHPDGLKASGCMAEVLAEAGIATPAHAGAGLRAPGGMMINEDTIRRLITSNDRLCREVFGALTNKPIEELDVSMLTRSEHRQLCENLDGAGARMDAEWVTEVTSRLGVITGNSMPGYTFSADAFTKDGRDFLLVRDRPSDERDMVALYSWPTESRKPLLEVNRGDVVMISEADIPSEEEVARLSGVLNSLVANKFGADSEFSAADNDLEGDGVTDITRVASPSPYRH